MEQQINYTEGLGIDYRHFMWEGIQPRFEFGFGLSYTESATSVVGIRLIFRFNYSNLQIWEIDGEDDWDTEVAKSANNGTREVGAFAKEM